MLLLCAAEMGCALAVVTGSLAARCGGDYKMLLLGFCSEDYPAEMVYLLEQ